MLPPSRPSPTCKTHWAHAPALICVPATNRSPRVNSAAIKFQPDLLMALSGRARMHLAMGQLSEAARDYAKALTLDPDSGQLRVLREEIRRAKVCNQNGTAVLAMHVHCHAQSDQVLWKAGVQTFIECAQVRTAQHLQHGESACIQTYVQVVPSVVVVFQSTGHR